MKQSAIRRPIHRLLAYAKHHKLKTILIVLFLLWAILLIYSVWPSSVAYSFSGDSCSNRLTLLPSIHSSKSQDFNYEYQDKIKIFGKDLAAKKVCFKPAVLLEEDTKYSLRLHPFDLTLLGYNYDISVPKFPTIKTNELNLEAVPLSQELILPLNKQDELFEYKLTINDTTVNCLPSSNFLECSTKNLGLTHNTKYQAKLDRTFNEQIKPVVTLDFTTVEPVAITNVSISEGQKIITKLNEIRLQTDRDIKDISGLKLESAGNSIDVTGQIEGQNLLVNLPADLPRAADYKLSIAQIHGNNQESLVKPYELNFRLEPGPVITGSSLQDRATDPAANITIYFNQELADADYLSAVKVYQDNQPISFSVYKRGGQLVINPSVYFARCSAIKIEFSDKVTNIHGVENTVQWQKSSRARCASSFSIGSSKEGRGIVGYSYGNGNNEVLYVGALHGDEYNSKRILEEWMWELEGNPGRIPAGTKVTVIPVLNPDGIAKRTRYNAANVDLNRNFPANNWKSDIVIQGGSTLVGGGGPTPLSEPESQAIASYIQSRRPSLVLTYHSQGGIVESNEAGIANTKTQQYANISGYGFKLASQNTGFFKYDVNGSLEEWAKDKLGQPVILVELSTRTYHDFSRNRAAMWAML